MYDAVIIGGGAVGCAVARELSRWKLKICLAEQGRTCAWAPARPIPPLFTPGSTPPPAL